MSNDTRMASFLVSVQKYAELFENGTEAAFDEALRAVDVIIAEGFQENFFNTTGPDGDFWQPRKDNLPHPLLIKTGKMFNAATNVGDPGHVFRHSGDIAEFGVSDAHVPYSKYHDRGTIKMVARPFAYATKQVQQRAFDAFVEVLDRHQEQLE